MATLAPLNIEAMLPATFTVPDMTEAQFLEFCEKFPEDFLEYTPSGTLIIMPPTDPESAARVYEVGFELGVWNRSHGRGMVFGPDGGFFLPQGSRRSPDACWFSRVRWEAAKRPGVFFPPFAPEFVVEVASRRQSRQDLRAKMDEYIANGVLLGWLIDPFERTVTIYRPGVEPEIMVNSSQVHGEGPVEGFVLPMDRVFTA